MAEITELKNTFYQEYGQRLLPGMEQPLYYLSECKRSQVGGIDFFLFSGLEVFDADHIFLQFTFADDRYKWNAALIGILHLFIHLS